MGNKTNRCGGVMKDHKMKTKDYPGDLHKREGLGPRVPVKGDNDNQRNNQDDKNLDRHEDAMGYDKGSFDFKSEKLKNKRNFKNNNYEHLADNPHNRAANKENPVNGSVLYKKYASGKGGADKVFKGTTPSHFTVTRIQA